MKKAGSKHRGGGQPDFNRLSERTGKSKGWYKKYTHRRNRKRLHQSRDIEAHCDRPLNAWDLD